MSRCLIVCIDGTWNSSAEKSRYFSYPTNVERIGQLLVNDGERQQVIYLPGVGTGGFVDRVIGGIWGAGSNERLLSGYRFLCENYREGDRLAFFGFSRGAFAVRAIIGVIARLGILRFDQLEHVPKAVSLYRRPLWMGDAKLRSFRESYCLHVKPEIAFVGVWDTVIRYGPLLLPIRGVIELTMRRHFGLYDHRIPAFVRRFCHALALDEQRAAFWPWRAAGQGILPDQVEEVWFAGSHSDVGGGYKESGPADFPLSWISEHAAKADLLFQRMPSVGSSSHTAHLNPSRVGPWRFISSRSRVVKDSDSIDDSVELRVRDSDYWPNAKLPDNICQRIKGILPELVNDPATRPDPFPDFRLQFH
jgi:uncharacterized protein (DUF2235 family)